MNIVIVTRTAGLALPPWRPAQPLEADAEHPLALPAPEIRVAARV